MKYGKNGKINSSELTDKYLGGQNTSLAITTILLTFKIHH